MKREIVKSEIQVYFDFSLNLPRMGFSVLLLGPILCHLKVARHDEIWRGGFLIEVSYLCLL